VSQSLQTERALALYTEALALDPRHTYALRQRASIFTQRGQDRPAIKDLTAALEVEPANILLLTMRARSYVQQGEDKAALADLDAALKSGRPDVSAINLRSAVHVRLGNDADALTDLNALIDGPAPGIRFALGGTDFSTLRLKRALVFSRLNRPAEAHADILKVVEGSNLNMVLRLQLLVRRSGFKEVAIDGVVSPKMLDALRACFLEAACQGGAVETVLSKA
jgi:tetratricopeptide (TPR) repeat protein